MESFRKLQQLRRDLDKVQALLSMVKRRERLKRAQAIVGAEQFSQQLYDLQHPEGPPRQPGFSVRVFTLANTARHALARAAFEHVSRCGPWKMYPPHSLP